MWQVETMCSPCLILTDISIYFAIVLKPQVNYCITYVTIKRVGISPTTPPASTWLIVFDYFDLDACYALAPSPQKASLHHSNR